MSSMDTGRMGLLKGTFLAPSWSGLEGLPGEDTSYCHSGDIKVSTDGCRFYTRHRCPYYTPSSSIGRTYCGCLEETLPFKRHGRLEFTGNGFVTTGSITMKHFRNGVEVLIWRCRNFHKNTIKFTKSNKSLNTNLILKNRNVSHLERGTHWVNIWRHFLCCENVVLLPNYIVTKIENIPPIEKFSKIKNKKTAITFDEECR